MNGVKRNTSGCDESNATETNKFVGPTNKIFYRRHFAIPYSRSVAPRRCRRRRRRRAGRVTAVNRFARSTAKRPSIIVRRREYRVTSFLRSTARSDGTL